MESMLHPIKSGLYAQRGYRKYWRKLIRTVHFIHRPSMLMTLNVSMMIVLTAVMGGVGTVLGPVLGAIVLTSISEYSRVYLGQYGGLDMILYGTLVILIVLFIPGGILLY